MPERSYRVVLWTLALLGVSLDQATKYGVFSWLHGREGNSYALFSTDKGGFQLVAQFQEDGTPRVNQGALFGFLRDYQAAANGGFAVISLLAALAIAFWSWQPSTARDPWLCAALGLILAGTLGNLYDRVVFSGVRDFLHWNYRFDWPVFNVADCCLVCGACLLLVQAFAKPGTARNAEPAAPDTLAQMPKMATTTDSSISVKVPDGALVRASLGARPPHQQPHSSLPPAS